MFLLFPIYPPFLSPSTTPQVPHHPFTSDELPEGQNQQPTKIPEGVLAGPTLDDLNPTTIPMADQKPCFPGTSVPLQPAFVNVVYGVTTDSDESDTTIRFGEVDVTAVRDQELNSTATGSNTNLPPPMNPFENAEESNEKHKTRRWLKRTIEEQNPHWIINVSVRNSLSALQDGIPDYFLQEQRVNITGERSQSARAPMKQTSRYHR